MGKNSLNHIAIIMDGNGRWAESRSHARVWGHIRGSRVVSNIIEEADALGAKALTLYTFSTENWSRPVTEVTVLFKLLRKFLLIERKRVLQNNIQFRVMGDISKLPNVTKELIAQLEAESAHNTGLKLTFAFVVRESNSTNASKVVFRFSSLYFDEISPFPSFRFPFIVKSLIVYFSN